MFLKVGRNNRGIKAAKGFVTVLRKQTMQTTSYEMAFTVASTTKKFPLNVTPNILSSNIHLGKVSLMFSSQPDMHILISKALPESLAEMLKLLKDIASGKKVELEKANVKMSDFKPRKIIIRNKDEYKKMSNNFSPFLLSLVVEPIGLRKPDRKWISCKNLTVLTLTGNPLGVTANSDDVQVFSKLSSLVKLDVSFCNLADMEKRVLVSFLKTLPRSIRTLCIIGNEISFFPTIFHLDQLETLDLSSNRICFVPNMIIHLQKLKVLNLSRNCLKWLPDVFRRMGQLETLYVSNNSFLPHIIEDPGWYTLPHPLKLMDFQLPGGVDTLFTIASNSVHRKMSLMKFGERILPINVRLKMHGYVNEGIAKLAIDVCSKCTVATHVRAVCFDHVELGRLAAAVDMFRTSVKVSVVYCKNCLPNRYPLNYPQASGFFEGNLE